MSATDIVINGLEARIRKLEADDAYVALKRNNDDLRERVERAEAERDALRALLREARDRSVYLAAPATDDHSISLRERIDAFLVWEKK